MEAIRSIMRGDLPPVGRRIIVSKKASGERDLPCFDGYYSSWVDSGTSALALAFLQAKSLRPDIHAPEVILPGYCCPDLVAAAHYAGVLPKVVDINVDDPALDINLVRSNISQNTIAVVAINFLGVAENLSQLMLLKNDFPQLFIVEDNAQWFPEDDEAELLVGDFVTFSFGRGKPLSLLGGGLLLSKYNLSNEFLENNIAESKGLGASSRLMATGKYFAYNRLLSPFLYQFLSRNPFITLGKTQYHPLESVTYMDSLRQELLPSNLQAFNQSTISIAAQYKELFESIGFENKFFSLQTNRCRRLLRYPLLFANVEQKNRVLGRLGALGLGATEMYKSALPQVDGVYNISVGGDLVSSSSFASRFITLPAHSGVESKHLQLIKSAFQS